MYVVVAEGMDEIADPARNAVRTLEQAFAQVCFHAGLVYHFQQEQDCWLLVLKDGERPECSPEPIKSTYVKRADAQRDLMAQAVDSRLKGWAAVPLEDLLRQREQAARLQAAE